jgi:hypothetical protein
VVLLCIYCSTSFFYRFIYYYKKIKSIEAIGCLDLENLSVLFVSSEVALIPHFQKAILRRPILIGIIILIMLDTITIRQIPETLIFNIVRSIEFVTEAGAGTVKACL